MIYVTELRKCYDIANRKDFDYSMCHGTQTQLQMSNNIKQIVSKQILSYIQENKLFHGPEDRIHFCAIFTFIKDFYGCKTILFQSVEFMNKTNYFLLHYLPIGVNDFFMLHRAGFFPALGILHNMVYLLGTFTF